jgi:single-stranded-DNA-specific exonuclease
MLKLHGPPPYSPVLEIDARIQIDQLNLALVQQLQTLAPFGQHHPEPLLVSEGARIQDIRVVGEQHLQLRIHPHIKAIGFGMGHLAPHIKPHMDIAFHWQIHRYKDQTYGQMHIQDLRLPL